MASFATLEETLAAAKELRAPNVTPITDAPRRRSVRTKGPIKVKKEATLPTVQIEQEYSDAIREIADAEDRSIGYVIRLAIKEYLENYPR